jgi:hypothetical protein
MSQVSQGASWRKVLERELRQDAGAHQRRLAGAGDAVDEHQSILRQPVDHLVDHLFATEEDRPFVLLEGTQPGIGLSGPRDGDWRGSVQAPASAGRPRAASSQSRN